MKRILRLLLHGILLTAFLSHTWGRWTLHPQPKPPRVEITWEAAMADGVITPLEVAIHYAPEIDAAVNVLLPGLGRGDFITAADFDGDARAVNNWQSMDSHPLRAVVYYSVQETAERYYVGYTFYHPRDDAEIWLDRHENDCEGLMLAIPRMEGGFAAPDMMYLQGHGGVTFCLGAEMTLTVGSRRGGALMLDGHRPVVYIAPNGTLSHAGHSVESADGHSVYWSVGNSGVRYYHGGEAQQPDTYNGAFARNRCSYALRSLDEWWQLRRGPYGDTALFADYGAFRGDDWRANAANPPWAWRNKTADGFPGAFLSDPVWTLQRAVQGLILDADYLANPYADWLLTFRSVTLPEGVTDATLRLYRDGWLISDPSWWRLTPAEGGYAVSVGDDARHSLWMAAPRGTRWRLEVVDADGGVIPGAKAEWQADYLDQ